MLRTKLGFIAAGTGMAVAAGVLCLAVAGSSQSLVQDPSAAAPADPVQVIRMDGYPLDRTLEGLVNYPDLDAVLVLSGVELGEPHWTTPDGEPPLYVLQNRPPDIEEVRRNDLIVTPVTGRISQVLRGDQFRAGDEFAFEVAGGRVGDVDYQADTEIAPDHGQLRRGGRILVAGEMRGPVIVPSFVYRLEADGNSVRSLLTSASDTAPDFGLADLKRALAARP